MELEHEEQVERERRVEWIERIEVHEVWNSAKEVSRRLTACKEQSFSDLFGVFLIVNYNTINFIFLTIRNMSEKKQEKAESIQEKPLCIRLDGWLWRVVAMTGAITELAKRRKVKVITSRPLVFWWNPFIESVHWLEDRDLFRSVIRGNDYIELEPYTYPAFFNDGMNRLEVASKILWLDKVYEPVLYLAPHEKIQNTFGTTNKKKILFQPFGSSVQDPIWADKSYRSLYVKDAQYLANKLNELWYEVWLVIRQWQPVLAWCTVLDTPDLRWIISLCDRYPLLWIDSSLHHCVKAFWKKAVVIRAWTDKERYGYESHVNLREYPMVAHTPMRLPMNSFDFDISNQHTNEFTKEFLDKVIEEVKNLYLLKK